MKKIIFFLILLLPVIVFAGQNLSESECRTYQNVDQRIGCYSSVAAQLDDVSVCNRADDNYINETLETDETMKEFLSNKCIEAFSIIKKNSDLCRKTIGFYQNSCFTSHGKMNKDIFYCLYIPRKQDQLDCIRTMADNYIENLSNCDKLSDQEFKNLCVSTASKRFDYEARKKANDNLFKNLNSIAEKTLLPLIFVFSLITGLIILKKFKKGYFDFKLINYLIFASFLLLVSLNFVNLLNRVFLVVYIFLNLLVVIFNLNYSVNLWIKNNLSAKKYIIISHLSPLVYCFLLSFGSSLYNKSFRINYFGADIIENMIKNFYRGSILIFVFGVAALYYKKIIIPKKTERRIGCVELDIFYIIFGLVSFILSWSANAL